jgi:hypothetical protein
MEASKVWNSIEFDEISSWDLRFWWILGKGYMFAPRWHSNHENEFVVLN